MIMLENTVRYLGIEVDDALETFIEICSSSDVTT